VKREKILILIPAYNEEDRIKKVINDVRKYASGSDILVVNDGSTDKTPEVSISSGAKVINLLFNLGVGAALQTGYKYAVQKEYQYLIQLDADGQHNPVYIPQLIKKIKEKDTDFIIGSRFLTDGKFPGSFVKLIGNRFFAKVISMLIHRTITDPTSGYRAMNRKVLDFFSRDIFPFDYPDADVILALHRAKFKTEEIPVVMNERKSGESQHTGLKPFYYIFKMLLSIFVTLLREKSFVEKKEKL